MFPHCPALRTILIVCLGVCCVLWMVSRTIYFCVQSILQKFRVFCKVYAEFCRCSLCCLSLGMVINSLPPPAALALTLLALAITMTLLKMSIARVCSCGCLARPWLQSPEYFINGLLEWCWHYIDDNNWKLPEDMVCWKFFLYYDDLFVSFRFLFRDCSDDRSLKCCVDFKNYAFPFPLGLWSHNFCFRIHLGISIGDSWEACACGRGGQGYLVLNNVENHSKGIYNWLTVYIFKQ